MPLPDAWSNEIGSRLDDLRTTNLLRTERAVEAESPVRFSYAGRAVVCFSSNDYLGLSSSPAVVAAAREVLETYGNGPRGSPLVCGQTTLHAALESDIARLKQAESALLFPTGFAANLGLITALAGPNTAIFSDELNHASIVDGCRMAVKGGAHLTVYPHRDLDRLDELLAKEPRRLKLVVTDSVFSMDGTLAPLDRLAELKQRHDFFLAVDDAHGTLVLGEDGAGAASHFGVPTAVDATVVTLGKAVGAFGGAVATTAVVKQLLMNRGRPYVFSTALPLPVVAAARAAFVGSHHEEARNRLWDRIAALSNALKRPMESPILSLELGDENAALRASELLLGEGFWVPAIRPPTVPRGTSRLRVTLSAAHRIDDVERLVAALEPFRTTASGDPPEPRTS